MPNTYLDKARKYFPFTLPELRNIILAILVIGFMYGFNDGQPEWNTAYWAYNMLVSMGIVAVAMFVFQAGQRIAGLSAGYKVEFQMWWPGLILALVITFIARGHIWIPIAGGMALHHMAGHRLGFFRYGINVLDIGVIAMCGPLVTVIFATIVKQIGLLIAPGGIPIIDKLYWFCLVFAWVNMLPIPPLAGSKQLFNSRLPYIFVFAFITSYVVLAYFEIYSWILAIIGAVILWFLYYVKIEND